MIIVITSLIQKKFNLTKIVEIQNLHFETYANFEFPILMVFFIKIGLYCFNIKGK